MTYTGELMLTASNRNGRTILSDSYHAGAFKLSRPVYYDDTPTYFLLHVGGGYVGGDHYKQMITLEKDTKLTLTTQSATKVYKTKSLPAIQSTVITIEENAHLTFLQDPVIAYEQAKFEQKVKVDIATGGSLFMTEIYTSGWSPSGDLFTYDTIRSDVLVSINGKKIMLDRVLWQSSSSVQTLLQYGDYTHYGSILCIDELNTPFYEQLHELMLSFKEVSFGLSKLMEGGFVMKVLAKRTQTIEMMFDLCEKLVREIVGRPAVAYRKY